MITPSVFIFCRSFQNPHKDMAKVDKKWNSDKIQAHCRSGGIGRRATFRA